MCQVMFDHESCVGKNLEGSRGLFQGNIPKLDWWD
jgi:hypothetical protein